MPATTPIHAILAVPLAAVVAQRCGCDGEAPKPLPQQNNCVSSTARRRAHLSGSGDAMLPYLYSRWGNRRATPTARRAATPVANSVATLIHADGEITFCSCGSEADNWAIAASLRDDGRRVVWSIEHPAILVLGLLEDGVK